jgi:hypothetical protein
MKKYTDMPTNFETFELMKKNMSEQKLKTNSKFLNLLNRFCYRYRMAKTFETIVARDVEKRTIAGYACGMKLFMSYSAYDEIRTAERIHLNLDYNVTHKHSDILLARNIKNNLEMKNLLLETYASEEGKLKKELRKFYSTDSDEIMIFATSLRHSFVHGDFTSARAGLKSKRKISEVNSVSDVVLIVSDSIFNQILKKAL